ncbi:hypothetical protein Tco_1024321 [Tanacetum coccineum]
MDDLIRNRNAKLAAFQQEINTLKQTLSNHVKEKESLSKTLTVFKTESKEKESKYIDKEIVLENQKKTGKHYLTSFLVKTFKHTFDTSVKSHTPVRIKAPSEVLKVVKKRTTFDAIKADQFDSIKKTRVRSKEHSGSLIAQIYAKSVKNSDLNVQFQEKVFSIATLKNELRKLKGKNVVDTAVSNPIATIAPGMFKLDFKPIAHRLKNNKDAHEFGGVTAKPLSTPMVGRSLNVDNDPFRSCEDDEEILGPNIPYLSAIGALMYLTNCTRTDISFAVNL